MIVFQKMGVEKIVERKWKKMKLVGDGVRWTDGVTAGTNSPRRWIVDGPLRRAAAGRTS